MASLHEFRFLLLNILGYFVCFYFFELAEKH